MAQKLTKAAIWYLMTNEFVEGCCCLVLLVLDLQEAMHLFYWMPLEQSRFHANNSTENENVIGKPAQDCHAIVWDW